MQSSAPRGSARPGVATVAADSRLAGQVVGEDRRLLDALPIAAAVVGRTPRGVLKLLDRNPRFDEVMAAIGDERIVAGDFSGCVQTQIADLMTAFLADFAAPDETYFAVGDALATRHFRVKLSPLAADPVFGPRLLVSLVDRTVEVRSEKTLRDEMLRDSLTGLPNRLGFTDTIERIGEIGIAADARPARDHAVLVVDLLRFSRINESMGSMAGDELLITFARRLMSTLRGGDLLARTGGNEFGVLVGARHGSNDAIAAAERIRTVTATPFRLSEMEIKVECAIGIALMQPGQDSEELFRSAQFAVKQAKASGRPQVYKPEEASAARRRFSIETELRRALDRDELRLAYQPLIDLKTGQVSGFEALARWTHEDRGEISPTEFIPVAEESGLILSLGRWVMDKAAATIAGWDAHDGSGCPLPISVAVNLSAIQVARDDIAEMVEGTLRTHALHGSRLALELTESAIVQDPRRATKLFEALKALDTTVAMDDFGTGYSSLAYLQRLPIDVLKIDRSFVTGMIGDRDSIAIVRAVLSLAEALGMETTAEGIESRELVEVLTALGCTTGQGFHFARPLTAEAALAFWQERHAGSTTGR